MPDAALLPLLMHRIAAAGSISIADYMATANAHYYATRDPLGAGGDFTTAPEISQMFGELVGIWIADLWLRAGSPAFRYVELGPGRGTLAVDALRAMGRFGCAPQGIDLVETSPVLRGAQAARLPAAVHHDNIAGVPGDVAAIIVANEFFDALPIHQYVATASGWRERVVGRDRGRLIPLPGTSPADAAIPAALHHQAAGTIVETSPAAAAVMHDCAAHLVRHGGAMLAIDYGFSGPATGDTLQAVKAHRFADPFSAPGEIDLTAHIDFTALAAAARHAMLRVAGPVRQGDWLRRIGIDARLDGLVAAAPDRTAELTGQRDRLVNGDAMGNLFQLLCAWTPGWPQPEGFGEAGIAG